jgi:hypothetical protein
VPADIRAGADLVLDAGPRPGISSTVIDLRAYERDGAWHVVRQGAMPADALDARDTVKHLPRRPAR